MRSSEGQRSVDQRHLFDYAHGCPELRSVDLTAAPNADSYGRRNGNTRTISGSTMNLQQAFAKTVPMLKRSSSRRTALAIRPESLEAWMALGSALNRAGRVDDHLHVARETLPRMPLDLENSKALGERGRARQQAGDLDIAAMRRYCERFPNDPRGHLILSMTLNEHLGKPDEAFRELRKVAELQPKPDDAKTYAWYPLHIATILSKRGRVDDAVEAYRMAIQFAPPEGWQRLRIVNTYAQAEMWKEAAACGHQLIEKNPNRLWIWLLQAPVLILGGNESGYREHCRRLVEQFAGMKQDDHANVTCKVCCLMPDAIDLDQLPVETIARSLDQGTMHDAARPWAWNALALVAYRKAEAKQALTYVQFSEDSAPNPYAHSLNLIVRAMAQMNLARIDEARIDVEEASKAVDDLPRDVWRYHDELISRILLREAKAKLDAMK